MIHLTRITHIMPMSVRVLSAHYDAAPAREPPASAEYCAEARGVIPARGLRRPVLLGRRDRP
jgi:hypothetical protein